MNRQGGKSVSFKLLGLVFIFFSGIYSAFLYGRSFDLRVNNLTLFSSDADFYINSVLYGKLKSGEITKELIKRQKWPMEKFYKKILLYLETGEEDVLDKAFSKELYLKKTDEENLKGFFKCLGKSDYQSQVKELEFKKSCIRDCLSKAVEEKNKNQRSGAMLTLGIFLTIIIFLI